jgi:hypothetical protein
MLLGRKWSMDNQKLILDETYYDCTISSAEITIDSITDLRKELDQLKEWLSYGKYSAKWVVI